ncbi:hypothetical protein [Pseudomonas benzenivorans]|uniref:DUF7352 domain-containing protein n=1 Tax=Pseudomonas benzenivorans TaxID=556533 RepID=UPI0035140081
MKTVHKYVIPFDSGGLQLDLAQGYQVLKSEYMPIGKAVCCWIEVPTAPCMPKSQVHLRLFLSGDGIPQRYHYVDTALNPLEPEAWHLYLAEQETALEVA